MAANQFSSSEFFGEEKVAPNKIGMINRNRGCQMVYFQTENPNLGIFWRALDWKLYGHLEYFTGIWDSL
jgi:hypothetical protein